MPTITLIGSTLVFVGGGVGACLRFFLSTAANIFFNKLWAGTLVVNVIGSSLMFLFHRYYQGEDKNLQLLLTTGLLGGFTTFSAFSFEMVTLLRQSQYMECSLKSLWPATCNSINKFWLGLTVLA